MAFTPPGGPMEVVFTLDTTGSMSQALDEVKGRVSDMMQRLLADIPGIRVAAVAHGDYCDEHVFYLTQTQNLTSQLPDLVNFVQGIEGTGGGDTAECYELVLRMVRENLDWTAGSQRILVMVGDAYPHPADDPQNKANIDWLQEVGLLREMGVKIYGVQVFEDEESSAFFHKMAAMTGGEHLKLTQFGHLCDVIMAICYREKGVEYLENFAAEVHERPQITAVHKDIVGVFDVLRRANSTENTTNVTSGAADTNEARPDTASISDPVASSPAGPATPDSGDGRAVNSSVSKLTTTVSAISLKVADPVSPLPPSPASSVGSTGKPAVCTGRKRKHEPRKRQTVSQRKPAPRKLLREKVTNNNFRLNSLHWTSWKLAAVPADQEVTSGKWRRILSGTTKSRCGVVSKIAASAKPGQHVVILEAAVQTRPGSKLHVTWCRTFHARAKNSSFSRLLSLSYRYARSQLEQVMRRGCRVFLRAAAVKQGQGKNLRRDLSRHYDYAWCRHLRSGLHRSLWVPNGGRKDTLKIAG